MQIFIGADYRGVELKREILKCLSGTTHTVIDVGAYEVAENGDDYNDPAIKVARLVRENPGSFGILICGSAHGMTIQANRFRGIRAANADTADSAKLAREHDDANVLCLSAKFIDERMAVLIVKTFLDTKFEPLERRIRRINRLDEEVNYD